ncbi:lipocalin family protein [Acinetobacter ihumii]|uniref:lipocalin family protein n=1 Tax=Acinetobacter ihumii TaxID=2483802 RepID=UPI0010307F02|nr:lipocalin family protein [Acinetobacter ihumii]
MHIQKKYILALGLVSTFALGCVSLSHADTPKPQAVDSIDVNKYGGKWYTIAYLPMFFQRQCASDTNAVYSLNPDQTIKVVNSCRNKSGEIESAEGVAYAANEGKSKLKVSFLPKALRWVPFTKGDYWVLRIDPEYQTALVGGPTHKYLWVLSRTPNLDEATYQSYLETARQQGYDLSKLIKEPHHAK